MRDYLHKVHEPLIVEIFEDFQDYGARDIWGQLDKGMTAGYFVDTALRTHMDGLQCAWGLQETAAVADVLSKLSDLVRLMVGTFPVEELQTRIHQPIFLQTALVNDAQLLRDLAVLLRDRPHVYPEGISGAAVSHVVLDAMTALVRGDDVMARESLVSARLLYSSPETPPGASESWLAPIDAVLDGDQAALAAAVAAEEQRWAKAHSPTRDSHAGPEALVHGHLTLICRVAGWRAMTPPTSCYIVPFEN